MSRAEDGLVYVWGDNLDGALGGYTSLDQQWLPDPVEALRRMRVGSIAAAGLRSFAVTCTGKLCAWGVEATDSRLGHGRTSNCYCPKPVKSLRGVKVDAVAIGNEHTLALSDDGSVYAWGSKMAAKSGALGLGQSVIDARKAVRTPQPIPELRCACGV
jgi:alpha-tubulin suppressor-like RCC1 family protein